MSKWWKFVSALLLASPMWVLAVGDDAAEKIRAELGKRLPGAPVQQITPTPMPGVYEVVMGPHLVYVSADGRYLIQGSMIDLVQDRDLTEPRLGAVRLAAIDQIGADDMVVFGPKNPKHTVSVFTDIDCGYCRRLHQDIDAYNRAGIAVRYLFFPRAGIGSGSYQKAVSVWCADDRRAALTTAKSGAAVEPRQCDNPVTEHYRLGQQIGVRGTPTIVTDDGRIIPGYLPPDELAAALEGGNS